MKVFAFINNKSAVGKTTLSRALAEYLCIIKKIPVLLVDLDPRATLSQQFLTMKNDGGDKRPPTHPDFKPDAPEDADWDGCSSIADIFYGEGVVPYPTHIPHLHIAPAHSERLHAAETVKKNEVVDKVHQRLADFLSSVDVRHAYKVVIIDTPPTKGPLTISAMKAATHIVLPVVLEEHPAQGVYGVLQFWLQENLLREQHRPLHLVGVLPTRYKNQNQDLLTSLQYDLGVGRYIMPVKISERLAIAEMNTIKNQLPSLFNLPNNHAASEEALAVCHYITERVFSL
jgi:chromosome partitioning protein